MSDKKEGFFTKEEQDEILNSIPKDPQYNGEVVKKENTGLLGFLKTKKAEETVDVDDIEVLSEESKEEDKEEEKEDKTDDKKEEKNEKNESTGFLTTLFGTGKVDCDKLLKNMNECVSEKDGTTMCRKQIDEWEKLCKDKDKDENKNEDKDENKDE